MKKKLILILFTSLLYACKEDDENSDPFFTGYDYVPLSVGQISIFQVDSILYDDFANTIDTISFQQREKITERFIDDAIRTAYRIELSTRKNDTSAWQVKRVFSALKDSKQYLIMDNNETVVTLIFPTTLGKDWDANALNTKEEKEYEIESVNVPYNLNGTLYDSTLTVLQEDEFNRIQQFYAEEKYAIGKGLIYRKDIQLETELNGDIRSGYEATVQLIEFTP